jgi:hypothetical protein
MRGEQSKCHRLNQAAIYSLILGFGKSTRIIFANQHKTGSRREFQRGNKR